MRVITRSQLQQLLAAIGVDPGGDPVELEIPTVTGTPSSGRTTGAAASLTVSHTTNGDPLLVIATLFQESSYTMAAATFNGVDMIPVGLLGAGGGAGYTYMIFGLPDVAAATANVVVTPVGSKFMALEAINVHGWSLGVRMKIATATSTAPSIAVPTLADTELVLGVTASDIISQAFTPGAGMTLVKTETDGTNEVHMSVSSIPGTGSPVTAAATLSGSDVWAQLGLVLLPAVPVEA